LVRHIDLDLYIAPDLSSSRRQPFTMGEPAHATLYHR
jgi:hypothetical protein